MNRWNDVGEPPIDVHPRDSLSDRNGYRDGAARLAQGTTDRFAHELTDRGGNPRSRGERKFMRTCKPCHGPIMKGDGPVAAMFMPPPDLLAETTRNRKDGYIFSYIRHGGMVMPPYGAQVTVAEAWDVIHYLRSMQKSTPR